MPARTSATAVRVGADDSAADAALLRLRGALVGAISAIAGMTAHIGGHGMLPGLDGLLLMLAACTALGWAVAAFSRSRPSFLAIATLLFAGQIVAHLSLAAMTGMHGAAPSTLMVGMHVTAAAAAAVLVRAAESVLVPLLSRLRVLVAAATAGPIGARAWWTPMSACPARSRLPVVSVSAGSLRGPPGASLSPRHFAGPGYRF